ncbi:hypothetical protein NKH77_11240 [Streptomyces sp. M19]
MLHREPAVGQEVHRALGALIGRVRADDRTIDRHSRGVLGHLKAPSVSSSLRPSAADRNGRRRRRYGMRHLTPAVRPVRARPVLRTD